MKRIIHSTGVLLLLFLVFGLNMAHAATTDLYRDGPPKDTDLDGLTDQGEIQLYQTDPNVPDTDKDGFLDGTEVLRGTNPLDTQDPVGGIYPLQQQKDPQWTWYLARTSGITSYLLLFLSIIIGIGITSGFIFQLCGPLIAWAVHRTVSLALIIFVAIHIITLGLDGYMKFSLADLLIPFYSKYNPLYLSLGIIGFYLLVLIIITSLVLIITKYKAWRFLHYLTFPAFVALFMHGVFLGTDSKTLAMQAVYWITGSVAVLAVLYRLVTFRSSKSRPKIIDNAYSKKATA